MLLVCFNLKKRASSSAKSSELLADWPDKPNSRLDVVNPHSKCQYVHTENNVRTLTR